MTEQRLRFQSHRVRKGDFKWLTHMSASTTVAIGFQSHRVRKGDFKALTGTNSNPRTLNSFNLIE